MALETLVSGNSGAFPAKPFGSILFDRTPAEAVEGAEDEILKKCPLQ